MWVSGLTVWPNQSNGCSLVTSATIRLGRSSAPFSTGMRKWAVLVFIVAPFVWLDDTNGWGGPCDRGMLGPPQIGC